MKAADYILAFLEKQNSFSVFGYPGGAIMPLYDALLDSNVKHYLSRHEQGAAFSAIGFARSTGRVGVCFGTSGPGATNLLTSIADAHLDSVPLLVITGQVASTSMGSDAFQEVDVLGLSLSITKHSFLVKDVKELPSILEQAFALTMAGRPGPVLVDVPKDILLTAMGDIEAPKTLELEKAAPTLVDEQMLSALEEANALIANAERPVAYVGGGVEMANAAVELKAFLQDSNIPAVATLKGLGSIPKSYPFNLGMLGMHGLPAANHAVQESDLLIVIGARLDDRATGKLSEFAPHAKLIHIDIDAAEINKRRIAEVAVNGDCGEALKKLQGAKFNAHWHERIVELLQQNESQYQAFKTAEQKLDAPSVLNYLSAQSPDDTVVCCDVGQHQMWVAQHMQFASPAHHLTSGGLGTMGFGVPAAIGAQVAHPNKTVIAVSGDGSFMMNIQELATISRYKIPVKLVVMDNQKLGMVKQWQELFHEERYSETDLSDNPEFAQVAQAFGLSALTVSSTTDFREKVDVFLNHDGPILLHVKLNTTENVWPIVPPNTANHKMMENTDAISN